MRVSGRFVNFMNSEGLEFLGTSDPHPFFIQRHAFSLIYKGLCRLSLMERFKVAMIVSNAEEIDTQG